MKKLLELKVRKLLLKFLHEVKENYPDINAGGCAVLAGNLGRVLERWFSVRGKVLSYYSEGHEVNSISEARENLRRNTIADWNAQGIDFNHILLEVDFSDGPYLVEASQVAAHGDFHFHHESVPLEGSLTVQEVYQLGSRETGWNKNFDRGNIPALRKDIRNFAKQLEAILD